MPDPTALPTFEQKVRAALHATSAAARAPLPEDPLEAPLPPPSAEWTAFRARTADAEAKLRAQLGFDPEPSPPRVPPKTPREAAQWVEALLDTPPEALTPAAWHTALRWLAEGLLLQYGGVREIQRDLAELTRRAPDVDQPGEPVAAPPPGLPVTVPTTCSLGCGQSPVAEVRCAPNPGEKDPAPQYLCHRDLTLRVRRLGDDLRAFTVLPLPRTG